MIRGGSGSYRLRMNQSEMEAEIHTLRDGGLLMQASICSLKTYLCMHVFYFVVFHITILFIILKFISSHGL